MRQLFFFLVVVLLPPAVVCVAQDVSPLKHEHIWLPMTGVTAAQMDDAVAAGYTAMMCKLHPPLINNQRVIDFTAHAAMINQATERGLKLVVAILGWVGLGDGRFWDTREDGSKIENQLDPFWPEAMEQVEWYYTAVMEHYAQFPQVIAFIPTWGIYGEAGFTEQSAGRSLHALARFNEWRERQGLPVLETLPTLQSAPDTEWNRFVRFRYLYLERQFDAMVKRLKAHAGGRPVGMWQELYPVIGYLWTMVEVPSADFALYESCFPFQTLHHPEKALAETMGFRYRCHSAAAYREYYLPLLARKRGEGQRFLGCQLSNDYVRNYGWTEEYAAQIGFDRYEDEFGPWLRKLHEEPLEAPERDVLLVFPTYAAAALSPRISHAADTMLIDALLRSYGCQMTRCGSPRLDKLSVEDLNRYRLVIVPCAEFVLRETLERLARCRAAVLFTGAFGRALDAEQFPFDATREVDGTVLRYVGQRPAAGVVVEATGELVRGLDALLAEQPVTLEAGEGFSYEPLPEEASVYLSCGELPLLSVRRGGRWVFLHGQVFAGAAYNPNRKPPDLGGSLDPSANEADMWGPYDSAHPQNAFSRALLRNLLDFAKVRYRVPNPLPLGLAPYLGDHLEQASISANIAYNNCGEPRELVVRTPYAPIGFPCRHDGNGYLTTLVLPPFSYIALQPGR